MQHRGLSFLVLLIGCDGATTINKNNDEPVAKIDDPADGSTVQAGSAVTFSGTVLDEDDDAETLVATWFSGADVLCAEAPVGADGATVCEVEIGLGDTEITLEGRDPDNAAGVASIRLSVLGSGHPEAQILTPDGTGPYYINICLTGCYGGAVATCSSLREFPPHRHGAA